MASSHVELVRSLYAAWGRGDFSSASWAHPEIEHVFGDGPTPGTWNGWAGLESGWRELLGAWKEFRAHAVEYRELDQERVLVLLEFRGRRKASGLEIAQMAAKGSALHQVRDGKVIREVFYFDREHALADLGLAPEGEAP